MAWREALTSDAMNARLERSMGAGSAFFGGFEPVPVGALIGDDHGVVEGDDHQVSVAFTHEEFV